MRAIDAENIRVKPEFMHNVCGMAMIRVEDVVRILNDQPTIQPEPHEIGYDDCANALLKMWMDNVLTDGDYYRIADKLNKKWGKKEVTT